MPEKDTFKDNQEYLAEFFAIIGSQKRVPWQPFDADEEPPKRRARPPRPPKAPSKEEALKAFKLKIKRSLAAGVGLPLEALAKKHKLSFAEKAVLVYFAGGELYRSGLDLGSMIGRFENTGIARAFETARLLGPDSPLLKKKLISLSPREFPGRCSEEACLPPKIFTLITGVKLRNEASKKRQPRVKGAASPASIREKLNEYVVGQEEAKKAISAGVFLHLKRSELNRRRKPQDRIAKSNILIIGPTGCGKTHICRTLAAAFNIPFHITDATQYTETGYVGKCVDEMLLELHKGKNLPPAAQAIIYVDEIDKLAACASGDGKRDVSGKSVQEELLKLLEGGEVSCERPRGMGPARTIDVSGTLFMAGGAFQGLEEIISARLRKKSIGFRGASGDAAPEGNLLRHVQPEDLIAYGFMPEFIGRFPVIAVLDKLGKAELVNIITGTRNSLLAQYRDVIEKAGLDIEIPADMPERVAEAALKRDLGARALKGIMEKWLTEEMFRRGGALPGPEAEPETREGTAG